MAEYTRLSKIAAAKYISGRTCEASEVAFEEILLEESVAEKGPRCVAECAVPVDGGVSL